MSGAGEAGPATPAKRDPGTASTERRRRPEPHPPLGSDPYGNPHPEWLSVDWSQHLRWVEVAGTPANVLDIGEGPPILYIHGLSGCWQNWIENILPFTGSHRVIAPDLPGFGESPMPDWEISIPNYATFVSELADTLELRDATVVGNSMGGFIAAELETGRPEWTERIVLVSAAGITSTRLRREPVQVFARMAAATSPLALQVRERMLRRPRVRWAAFRNVVHRPLDLRTELLWEQWKGGVGAPAFADALIGHVGYDIRHTLTEVDVPTAIIWGHNDRVVPAADAPEYARLIAHSELEVFAETGHLPMTERPVRFNRLLDRFIAAGTLRG